MEVMDKMIPENSNDLCPGVQDESAGKIKGCEGCPNQQACASGKGKADMLNTQYELSSKLEQIKHKIIVLSGKGGVGKSTVSAQLAFSLANKGYQVGLLDIDLCGPSIPRMLNLQNSEVVSSNSGWSPVYFSENLGVISIGFLLNGQDDAVIWRGPRKTGLIKQFILDVDWGDLDFLIVDTPPGTSDEHISITQYLQMHHQNDGVIIVTTPQEIALLDVRKELNFCSKSNLNVIGVVENMSGFSCPNCQHCTQIFQPTTGGAQKMCNDYNLTLLGKVPIHSDIALSSENGQKVQSLFDPIINQIEKHFLQE